MKRRKSLKFTTRYVIGIGVILLVANIVLGVIDFQQSTSLIKSLINKSMLDLANTAADLIDGDALAGITEDDTETEDYRQILDRLSAFQNNADIHFIYAIRQTGAEEFVFTVDADPEDPADYGEEVVVTPGMIAAGAGIPAVDEAPAADRWGNYYSAFSPVFDSSGRVAGVIGVDFDADWFDAQVRTNAVSISFSSILSVLGIAAVVVLISQKAHKRFADLNAGLSEVSADMDRLTQAVGFDRESAPEKETADSPPDDIEELRFKIDRTQKSLRLYLDYLEDKAYIDALTKVQNSTAYHEAIRKISEQIESGAAGFWIAVFDINGLKEINDQFGHEQGDQVISSAAKVIGAGFDENMIYRIGGDEFAVIAEGIDEEAMAEKMARVDGQIAARNAECSIPLAISKGAAAFRPEADASFKDVFGRADQLMYEDKQAFYRNHPDRRGSRHAASVNHKE